MGSIFGAYFLNHRCVHPLIEIGTHQPLVQRVAGRRAFAIWFPTEPVLRHFLQRRRKSLAGISNLVGQKSGETDLTRCYCTVGFGEAIGGWLGTVVFGDWVTVGTKEVG